MNRWLRFILYTVVWCAIGAYVIYSSTLVARHGKQGVITDIEVRLLDSTSQSTLVRERRVYDWIEKSGYAPIGETLSQLDLLSLEELVSSNAFISSVNSYVDYDGLLRVDIEQRDPLLRLRMDGYDCYITYDGFVFSSPPSSAHYCLVATGSYKPIFPASYQGYIEDSFREQMLDFDKRIEAIEREKYPIYEQQRELKMEWKEFYRNGYVKRKLLEPESEYSQRLKSKKLENHRRRGELNYRARYLSQRLEAIEKKRQKEIFSQNIFIQKYEDIKNLIIFAKRVEKDRFWRAEVVQLVLSDISSSGASVGANYRSGVSGGANGSGSANDRSGVSGGANDRSGVSGSARGDAAGGFIDLKLIPRSSSHVIRFGSLERMPEKLSKLETFYKQVLKQVGWDRYKVIDIEYKNQVVCR